MLALYIKNIFVTQAASDNLATRSGHLDYPDHLGQNVFNSNMPEPDQIISLLKEVE